MTRGVVDARTRIDQHRLMQRESVSSGAGEEHRMSPAEPWLRLRGVAVHCGAFVVGCLMAIGAATTLAFLWARPNNLGAVVCTGLVAACTFVASYAYIHVRHAPNPVVGEGESTAPHIGRSVVYGVLALVLALCGAALVARAAPIFIEIG